MSASHSLKREYGIAAKYLLCSEDVMLGKTMKLKKAHKQKS